MYILRLFVCLCHIKNLSAVITITVYKYNLDVTDYRVDYSFISFSFFFSTHITYIHTQIIYKFCSSLPDMAKVLKPDRRNLPRAVHRKGTTNFICRSFHNTVWFKTWLKNIKSME